MNTWMYVKAKGDTFKANVSIQGDTLTWSYRDHGVAYSAILESRQIIAALCVDEDTTQVHVHYVTIAFDKENVKLKRNIITIYGEEKDCRELVENVQRLLEKKESHRPKRLLVFINPGCGSKNNVATYHSIVAPLLELYGVTTHVIETSDPSHPTEVLATFDLSSVDVVVSMGGDGSLNLVLSGLLKRTMRDAGASLESDDDKLIKPSVTFATLPGGMVNAVAQSVYSSMDLQVCTLAIILGKRAAYDVMTVHDDYSWVGTSCLFVTYGVITHALMRTERFRWLGTARRFVLAWITWWFWESHDILIDYLPYDDEVPDRTSDLNMNTLSVNDGPTPGWKTIKLPVSELWVILWSQRNFVSYYYNPKYQLPNRSDEKMAIRIIRKGRFFRVRQALLGYSQSLLTEIPVQECRIRVDKPGHYGPVIGCDAEKIQLTNGIDFRVRLHSDRLDIITIDGDLVAETRAAYAKEA